MLKINKNKLTISVFTNRSKHGLEVRGGADFMLLDLDLTKRATEIAHFPLEIHC